MRLSEQGVYNLIAAIVNQAIEDYKLAISQSQRKEILEIREFFYSEWFEFLVGHGNAVEIRKKLKL